MNILRFVFFIGFISYLGAEHIALKKFAEVPQKAVYMTQPPSEKQLLFVVNQDGYIHIIDNGELVEEPFLDISDRVYPPLTLKSKKGLWGLAFHPKYQQNGYIFLSYINKDNISIISRFNADIHLNKANKESEKILLELDHSSKGHNGIHLAFGPQDNMLYVGVGDGIKSNYLESDSQNLNTLFGSILRIDIDNDDPYNIPLDNPFIKEKHVRHEIFCYGLKNPSRFSFDQITHELIIPDVGDGTQEELNWISIEKSRGANFGWPIMDGKHCFDSESFCDTTNFILPIHAYSGGTAYLSRILSIVGGKTNGCSIVGGRVYKGSKHDRIKKVE